MTPTLIPALAPAESPFVCEDKDAEGEVTLVLGEMVVGDIVLNDEIEVVIVDGAIERVLEVCV